jgi:EAL domain-containing protein (putative c-di-GMP-specific phosphodiesterase class I)
MDEAVGAEGLRLAECLSVQADEEGVQARPPAMLGETDLLLASQVYDAMLDDRLSLVFQPVLRIGEPREVLYHECLARVEARGGDALSPDRFVPALERLHLVRMFDRYVVRLAMRVLVTCPRLTIGVNVSARSVVSDGFWTQILLDLSRQPGVAERLVVEVTETAQLRLGQGRALIGQLRHLGCRAAIDDFGAGYGVQTGMEIGEPDIIKIDASLLEQARNGRDGMIRLERLVKLARTMSGSVVLEGVESEADVEIARASGVGCLQGYYFGRPVTLEQVRAPGSVEALVD